MSFFVKLPDGTEQEILDFNVSIGDAVTHIETLTDKDGNVIARKPTITTQPIATTIDDTQTAILSVVADGLGSTLSYQWYIDDTAISGATEASYTFDPSATGAYSFYCRVNGFGGYTQTDAVNVIVESSGSIHQWTIGTDETGLLLNYYGFIDDTATGGDITGQFSPRDTIVGHECSALVSVENKEPSDPYAVSMMFNGDFTDDISIDVSGYGVIAGTITQDGSGISTLTIWDTSPSSPGGATNGEGFRDFIKANLGGTVTLKITTE